VTGQAIDETVIATNCAMYLGITMNIVREAYARRGQEDFASTEDPRPTDSKITNQYGIPDILLARNLTTNGRK